MTNMTRIFAKAYARERCKNRKKNNNNYDGDSPPWFTIIIIVFVITFIASIIGFFVEGNSLLYDTNEYIIIASGSSNRYGTYCINDIYSSTPDFLNTMRTAFTIFWICFIAIILLFLIHLILFKIYDNDKKNLHINICIILSLLTIIAIISFIIFNQNLNALETNMVRDGNLYELHNKYHSDGYLDISHDGPLQIIFTYIGFLIPCSIISLIIIGIFEGTVVYNSIN